MAIRKRGKDSAVNTSEIDVKKQLKKKQDLKASSRFVSKTTAVKLVCAAVCFWVSHRIHKHLLSPDTVLARADEDGVNRFMEFNCSDEYAAQAQVDKCTPKRCGRLVRDDLFTDEEIDILSSIAEEGSMAVGGGSGPVSIIELHSSTVSYGEKYISLFARMQSQDKATIEKLEQIYSKENMDTYTKAKRKVQEAIANSFGVDKDLLHLSSPTFFSRITNAQAKTVHDEYWHKHIDTNQYAGFHYTALIYLNTHGKDYKGGAFIFDQKDESSGILEYDQRVEPKRGRVGTFTSGSENPHHVEKVTDGVRFAFTMGFTCDKSKAIPDPSLPT